MGPRRTIDLLVELDKLGFPEEAFSRLHHFRLEGKKESIASHRKYCDTHDTFVTDGDNERTQQRLEMVLNAYQGGGFRSGKSSVFIALADAVFYELPPKQVAQRSTPNAVSGPGIYIVTLNNSEPISVNAGDKRIAEKCIKVTRGHCKFGQAQDLASRKKDYLKHFGEANVNFIPLAQLRDAERVERAILLRLDDFRIRGKTGRKNEWLVGIEPMEVERIVFSTLDELHPDYERLGTVMARSIQASETPAISRK